MNGTQDTIDLSIVQAQLSAGLDSISDQLDLIGLVAEQGGDGGKERIELWQMERDQAELGNKRLAILARLDLVHSPPVVLVVENDILVLMATAGDLRDAGFIVIEALNADDAIEVLRTNAMIRALFTDVQMPGSMNGLELARRVHRRWPLIKVIVTSGNALLGPADVSPGDTFMSKPYRSDDVVVALNGS